MRHHFFLFSLFLFLSSLSAQTQVIKGRVLSVETGKPIVNAEIKIKENGAGTTTNGEGAFSLKIEPTTSVTLLATHVAYLPQSKIFNFSNAPNTILFRLKPYVMESQPIVITDTRATRHETPVTFSNKSAEEIKNSYAASDVPMLLNDMPNMYVYSLTGDEIGYSFVKIRGFDQKRVGVMINDIPLNDPEDQQVYWVDMPDLAENIEDIQVQRGIGSSVYGTSTFGGSININTSPTPGESKLTIQYGGGSFNTRKFSSAFNSGLVAGKYSFYGRYSQLSSTGFRKNSESKLWSYYFNAARYDDNMVTKLNLFGGPELTKPDWDGIPQNILAKDRTYKKETYNNSVDNFHQQHYQLINEWDISDRLQLSNSVYMIKGLGYYENLKTGKKLSDFGMSTFQTSDPSLFGTDSLDYYLSDADTLIRSGNQYSVKRTDLVRQKWVDKTQLGFISKANFESDEGKMTIGLSGYLFNSEHYGKVVWAKNLPSQYSPEREYYNYNGDKKSLSAFVNYLYKYTSDINILSNLLYEYKTAGFKQNETALFNGDKINSYNIDYSFLSPRMGINYTVNKNLSLYSNLSGALREPSDDDLYNTFTGPDDIGVAPLFAQSDTLRSNGKITGVDWKNPYVKPEELVDFELGINYTNTFINASVNLYWMDFRNEIIASGGLDKDGSPIKGNAESTIHRGIELTATSKLGNHFQVSGNFAYSQNFFKKFIEKQYNWSTGKVDEVDLSGNNISSFPSIIANLKFTANYGTLFTSLSVQHIGKQYLDNTENESRIINSFTTMGLFSSYKIITNNDMPDVRIILKINNLLDAEYETAGYYDPWSNQNYYWPAAGRNIYAGLQLML